MNGEDKTSGQVTAVRRMAPVLVSLSRIARIWVNRQLGRRPKHLPVLLMAVTHRCNLRCAMCGVWNDPRIKSADPELTRDEWYAVVNSAKRLGVFLISITGGEPLLRDDVYDIIRYGRDRGIGVHICTNGALLTDERVERLVSSGVNTVSISVESPEPSLHDALRGEGSFDQTVAGIRRLRERAPELNIGINYVITARNFRNMLDMIPFAEGLGVNQLKFAPIHTNLQHREKVFNPGDGLLFSEDLLPELDQYVRNAIQALRKTSLGTTSITFLRGITSLYRTPQRFRCYAGYAVTTINPWGVVSPCCDIAGNQSVRDTPLEAIWHGRAFRELCQCVHRCSSPCWDTTNTELSLRFAWRCLATELLHTWRDIGFYFGRNKP
ncbi:MAG TPA: radical SAM protein [Candidatus Hydrogenedentes bacterium]|nr:radical SAM protein [Candidatus Hydrogenedentota bacterium]